MGFKLQSANPNGMGTPQVEASWPPYGKAQNGVTHLRDLQPFSWVWVKKPKDRRFGPGVHLPRIHFGYLFLTHSQLNESFI